MADWACIDLSTNTTKFVWIRDPEKIRGHYGMMIYIDDLSAFLQNFEYEITDDYDYFIHASLDDVLSHTIKYKEEEVF